MKKVVLVFGSISGFILGAMFFVTMPLYQNGMLNFDNSMWIGYTTMVLASSLTFFGVKSYRDRQLGGVISFGTALKTGTFIALVASIFYVISWEINLKLFAKDFMEFYSRAVVQKAEFNGASATEISKLKSETLQMAELYKNPFFRVMITWIEIFPVGFVVALICAAILRKKEVLPA